MSAAVFAFAADVFAESAVVWAFAAAVFAVFAKSYAVLTALELAAVFSGDDQSGYSYIITSKEIDLKDVANDVNKALSGRGGGKPNMIQGSVTAKRSEIEAFWKTV